MMELNGEWGEVQKQIRAVNIKIRHAIPRSTLNLDTFARIQIRQGFLNGRRIERIVVVLKSSGCKWATAEEGAGGCSMCGHIAGTSRGTKIPAESFINQFKQVFDNQNFLRFPMLCLYNSGSFFNPEEIPVQARHGILQMIDDNDDIERIIVESRPEFITTEILDELSRFNQDKVIEIGVGFETQDNMIRNAILNKGIDDHEFYQLKEKVKIMGT